jgi:arylsulfatase A-like enzyme
LAATNATPPADIDGISLLPTLLGKPGQPNHDSLYWEYHGGGGSQAVRFGDWKAVRSNAKKTPAALPELYNLKTDPAESTNVAETSPEQTARAIELLNNSRTPSPRAQWNF